MLNSNFKDLKILRLFLIIRNKNKPIMQYAMVINVLFFLQKKKEAKMADQISILNNPYQVEWAAYAQEKH